MPTSAQYRYVLRPLSRAAFSFACLWALPSSAATTAEMTPAARGRAIAAEADRRDLGWKDMSADLTMVLRNRHGNEASRKMRMQSLEMADDGDRMLVVFRQPHDVKGTALLTYSHRKGPDDQWLYMPALRRVKRLSSNNRSGPFMGSEFAYEDLGSQEVERYTYRYLRADRIGELDCHVIERVPAAPRSGYKRQVVWIDGQHFRFMRIEFFDRKDAKLKTLQFNDFERFGTYWRPHELAMTNHQTGKSTSLLWTNYRFGNGFTERQFDQSSLRRAR